MSADPVSQTPLVLGHPATAQWCEAVDAHHAITEEIAANLRTRNLELYEANQSLTAKLESAERELQRAREALKRIERWFGEFPETGHFWPDSTPQSYGTAFGSNGERDYMRAIARAALKPAADGAAGKERAS